MHSVNLPQMCAYTTCLSQIATKRALSVVYFLLGTVTKSEHSLFVFNGSEFFGLLRDIASTNAETFSLTELALHAH